MVLLILLDFLVEDLLVDYFLNQLMILELVNLFHKLLHHLNLLLHHFYLVLVIHFLLHQIHHLLM